MSTRFDTSGMWWHDPAHLSRRERNATVSSTALPPFPDTGWGLAGELPRLDAAKRIAIDVETYDPDLKLRGPGVRRDGYIVGLAVGTDDARWYFPMRHSVQRGLSFDADVVLRWARDELCRPRQPKVGANLLYDLDYLYAAGVPVAGPFYDVQVAEPLLDENAFSYSLDAIARKHLQERKRDEALYRWSAAAYGGKPERAQAANIYRCPPCLVGPYAEGDVDLPLRILDKQRALLREQNLEELFELESRLIPLLLAMRQRGVRVDLERAQQLYDMLTERIQAAEAKLDGINVYAAEDIAHYCRKHNLEFGTTKLGKPSFTIGFLEHHPDPLIRSINDVRKWYKTRDTFVKGYILDSHVNGRVHCQFNQLRGEDGGAVSGRFSSSMPNLQNIPARDAEIAPLMRSLFLPDDGEQWARLDWSQIEFRFLTHYAFAANSKGAETACAMYNNDPTTDFHQMTAELTGIDRKPAKSINFGLVYGMGEKHMAATLGRTLEEVQPLFDTYHTNLPFVRATYDREARRANMKGLITTLLNRRRRFDQYEVHGEVFASKAAAEAKYPKLQYAIRRAFTHKALNAKLQGSAADAMKKAMVEIWESGLCTPDHLGAPLLTVHDELDFSYRERCWLDDVRHIMETCVKLHVPVVADMELGADWGHLSPAPSP